MTKGIDQGVAQEWLKASKKRLAFKILQKQIISTGVCTECGTCVAICPEDALTGVRVENKYTPTLTGECSACGLCYTYCPRTTVLSEDLIGTVISAWQAKAVRSDVPRQNGGVVTAILSFMIENGMAEGAVTVGRDDELPWLPLTKLETAATAAIMSGGTVYAHTPVVEGILRGFEEGLTSLVAVSTSCGIDAIDTMETHPANLLKPAAKHKIFKVGLFCMEAFDYSKLVEFLKGENVDISDVTKFEISGGKFRVFTETEEREWPIKDLDSAAASSCVYCRDLTSKNADISVGNIGSDDDLSTVLVRTKRGEEVFKEMIAKGVVEAEPLEPKALRIVERVARSKVNRIFSLKADH